MNHNITGALITAAAGLFIAFANYLISEKVLTKAPQKLQMTLRNMEQEAYCSQMLMWKGFWEDFTQNL